MEKKKVIAKIKENILNFKWKGGEERSKSAKQLLLFLLEKSEGVTKSV